MTAELSPGTERWARAAWTRVAEPDDPSTHALIGRLGAGEALSAVLRGEPWVPEALRLRVRGIDLDAMVRFATRQGWRLLIPGDPDWPTGLDQLANPPVGLWVHGPADLAEVGAGAAAVVGSRACTAYGLGMAHDLGAGLASRGYVVVSGAAFGIDRAAHEGCLSVHGMTVAVLAGGLDRPYPAGNADLIADIARVGALVSEVAPGGAPTKSRFLKRNRLIATMTAGTVVVEAGLRSGSLNTATQAAEHGRPVGAVPGQVTSRASAGCHQAIRDGKAVLVTDVAEVLDLLGRMGLDAAPRPSGPTRPEDELPPPDREVLAVVPVRAASTVTAIAAHAGVTLAQAQASLARLAVVGAVARVGDSWQQRPRRTVRH